MGFQKILSFQIPLFCCQRNHIKQVSTVISPALIKNIKCSHKELNLWCINWAHQWTKDIGDVLSYTALLQMERTCCRRWSQRKNNAIKYTIAFHENKWDHCFNLHWCIISWWIRQKLKQKKNTNREFIHPVNVLFDSGAT